MPEVDPVALLQVQMGQRQDAPLVDLSGLGSQLGDLDRKLVKDLEAAAPTKSGTIRR